MIDEKISYQEAVSDLQRITKTNETDFAKLLHHLIEHCIKQNHDVRAIEYLAKLVASDIG